MGSLTSRQNAGVEEVDIVSNHAYKYPPRSGNYFGSHFIMGGERFDTPQPEAYLFGENADLNFLGNRPTPFPYPPPQANDPTKTLKCLINIRKESLRLVRNIDQSSTTTTSSESNDTINAIKNYNDNNDYDNNKKSKPQQNNNNNTKKYNIEFTFDCDVNCSIKIYYFCTEEITTKGITYLSRDASINSEIYYYKKGTNQQFIQPSHIFEPKKYSDDDLLYNIDKEIIPIAIHCIADDDNNDDIKQSHTTIGIIEKHSDDLYLLKALKQKLYVDGLCYLLQEIYGIENKNNDNNKQQGSSDDDNEDNGSECVICMCDVRDTLILPCRHLCLCYGCADSLRYQANNCPICRSPFRALLQIKALQKSVGPINNSTLPSIPDGTCDNIPSGYEAVSLIEALNGPYTPRAAILPPESPDTPDTDTASAIQAAEVLNRPIERTPVLKHCATKDGDVSSGVSSRGVTATSPCPTPEFRMSVLLTKQDNHSRTPSTKIKITGDNNRDKNTGRVRDTLRLVNEKPTTATLTHYEAQGQDDDSEAEKLSPLLDDETINSNIHKSQMRDNNIDDEDDEDDDEDDLPETETDSDLNCHPH